MKKTFDIEYGFSLVGSFPDDTFMILLPNGFYHVLTQFGDPLYALILEKSDDDRMEIIYPEKIINEYSKEYDYLSIVIRKKLVSNEGRLDILDYNINRNRLFVDYVEKYLPE